VKTSVDSEAAPTTFPLGLVELEASYINDTSLDCLNQVFESCSNMNSLLLYCGAASTTGLNLQLTLH